MKIEKINDNQIRCTLTKADLEQREIRLSELAYGSAKTRSLFRDMMQQAFDDFGFDANEAPLMIEAIPLSSDVIVLIISKVDSPDELDTRFSRFTQVTENADSDTGSSEDNGALLDLDEMLKQIPTSAKKEDRAAAGAQKQKADVENVRLFSFTNLDAAIHLSHLLGDFYRGNNTIYKDPASGIFRLVLRQSDHSVSEFNRVSHLVAEYLTPERYSPGAEAYFKEHLTLFLPGQALQTLSEID